MKAEARGTVALQRLACRIQSFFYSKVREDRHLAVEQMLQVRAERGLGNNKHWNEKPTAKVVRNGVSCKVGPEMWSRIYIWRPCISPKVPLLCWFWCLSPRGGRFLREVDWAGTHGPYQTAWQWSDPYPSFSAARTVAKWAWTLENSSGRGVWSLHALYWWIPYKD